VLWRINECRSLEKNQDESENDSASPGPPRKKQKIEKEKTPTKLTEYEQIHEKQLFFLEFQALVLLKENKRVLCMLEPAEKFRDPELLENMSDVIIKSNPKQQILKKPNHENSNLQKKNARPHILLSCNNLLKKIFFNVYNSSQLVKMWNCRS